MSRHTVYIGLGSNLAGPVEQVKTACQSLNSLPNTQVIQCSQLYASKPQGPQDQPDFVNAVCLLETDLTPFALLDELQNLEQSQGRIKKRHWGERHIDLDILMFDQDVFCSDRLTVPHVEIANRDFFLLPLAELTPGLLIPKLGSVEMLIANLKTNFVKPWQASQ